MSIWTGKDGYDAIEEFTDRTLKELRNRGGVIFRRDTQPPEHEVAFVKEQLVGCRSVLELGSGLGAWEPHVLSIPGVTCYVGVDPVPERVRYANANAAGVDERAIFCVDDARTVRLGRTFDAVLFVTVLQHMTLPDAIEALRTAAAHLEPGGKVVLIESRLLEATVDECEDQYAREENTRHMIPKPLSVLRAAVPTLEWWFVGPQADRWVLKRTEGS